MEELNTESVRSLTVEILHYKTDIGNIVPSDVVGTGFMVSSKGHIITCSHVVEGAISPESKPPELLVRFPEINNLKSYVRNAEVLACLDSHHDDVALLKLKEENSSLPIGPGPEKLVTLDVAEGSLGCGFITYGYGLLPIEDSGFCYCGFGIDGKVSSIFSDRLPNMLCRRVKLDAKNIIGGFSGAPVVVQDMKKGGRIVGIICETTTKEVHDFGIAVDAKVLFLHDPFKEYINFRQSKSVFFDDPLPKTTDQSLASSLASKTVSSNLDKEWKNDAPQIPEYWVERDCLMNSVADSWKDETIRLICLVGRDGDGKTTLARKWIENLLNDKWQGLSKPKRTFWWSFRDKPSVETFFKSALNYIRGEIIDQSQFRSIYSRMNSLAEEIHEVEKQDRCLFILDDLDALQHYDGTEVGRIKNEELRQFISDLALFGHCLAISSIPLFDHINQRSHIQHDVAGLSKEEGRELLRKLGAKISDEELDKVVLACSGRPLMLTLKATTLQ